MFKHKKVEGRYFHHNHQFAFLSAMIRLAWLSLLLAFIISAHCISHKNVVEIDKNKHYDGRLMSALKKITSRSPRVVKPAQSAKRKPSQSQRIRNTAKPPIRTSSTEYCATHDFTNSRTCCKSLPDSLVSKDNLLACNDLKSDDALFSVSQEYTLNWYQDPKTNDRVDFTATKTIREFGAHVCFAVCLFKRAGMMNDAGLVNYSNVATEMTKGVSDLHWLGVTTDGISNCQTVVDNEPVKVILYKGGNCNLQPALILQCVRKYLITGCPNFLYSQSDACFERMKNLGKCNAFNLDINSIIATSSTTSTAAPA